MGQLLIKIRRHWVKLCNPTWVLSFQYLPSAGLPMVAFNPAV